MNITLIGMPGSGKSYIGKKIAQKIGYKLVELDSLIEQEHKLPLQGVLDKLGESIFIEVEGQNAIHHTKTGDDLVISPGGSIVYSDKAMEHLNKVSKIIYLKTDFHTIKKRVGDKPRGIVGLKNKKLEELYEERTALYEKWAAATIAADTDPEKIIDYIVKSLTL